MKKIFEFIKDNYMWLIIIIGLFGFIALAEDVFEQEILYIDKVGYDFISNNIIMDNITPIAKIFTFFGSALCLITITVLSIIVIKNKKISLSILINLCVVSLLNVILKNVMQRPRPNIYRLIEETGYSFPSGHSMASMAFYGFLIYLTNLYIKNKVSRYLIIMVLSVLIVMIGTSRIYLGVHYTSDVIGGYLVSLIYLILFIKIYNKYIMKEKRT